MAASMANHPAAFSNFLCALDFLLASPMEVAVAGIPDSEQARKLLRVVTQRYQPNKVIACGTDGHVNLLRNRPQIAGNATAYICRNQTCSAPVTSAEDLERLLKEY
jgi:hypothetical protein